MNQTTIALCVATLGDAELLETCLSAAVDFDEIVLVNMNTGLDLSELSQRHGARLLLHEPVTHVELIRGTQLGAVTAEWVLFLDPDEVLPSGWVETVRCELAAAPQSRAAYWVRYQTIAFGARLQHTRTGVGKVALARRSLIESQDDASRRPHEMLRYKGDVGHLPAGTPLIDHFSYRSVKQMIEKIARYATKGGVESYLPDHEIRPLTAIKMLWGSVVQSGAWRDGSAGVAVASLSAIGDYLGLLQQWDERGQPEALISRSERGSILALTKLHSAQWAVRRPLRRRDRG